jgi:hypothetical protein
MPQLSLIVIRATDIEETMGFYRAIGLAFQEEQHGSGPLHYSCTLDGVVLEIYPHRPKFHQTLT